MKNFEYYKGDAEALNNAFSIFCGSHRNCLKCTFANNFSVSCELFFASAEHEEPPAPPTRRAYTYEEAKGLLGKRLEYVVGEDCRMEIIYSIRCIDNVVCINHASCKFYMEDAENATIDGEPFGVLEGGAE